MNRHLEIFAKSPQNGGVSLFDHLQQTALAADKIACELGLNSSLIKCGAFLHDIGKTHPVFQEKLNGKKDFTKIDFRHEIASLFFLPLFQRDYWHPLTEMIIAHHRSPVKDIREQGIIDLIEIEGVDDVFERHIESWDNWSTIALEILEALGLKTRKLTRNEALEAFNFAVDHCEQKPLGWSKLKGILISSDYLASALTDNTINVLPKLFRVPDLKYFSSDTRKSPLYPLSMMNTADKRKHTIVIAPTGAGKTDFLMRRCSKRVFYILPFQASINAMYKRFKSSLPPETDIRLLHAASSVVIKNKNEYEEKVLQPLVGSSVKVLTPHQIASLICGTRGFESIAVDIAGCDVILDEIHCYSDLSQSMVIEIIKVLIKLNCTVHVGTATMPGALLKIIHELLGGEENVYLVRLPEKVLDTFNRHKILKHENELSALSVVDKAVCRNEKILIVCNRVEIAQKRFYELKKKYDGIPMLLLHSRFRRIDRSLLEDKLKNEFNDRDKLPGSCIVVSTQVVEVSLDISFDIMITDAAPLDSLIQRFGRINRYRTEETLKKKTIKEIHVIAPPENLKDCLPYKKEIVSSSFDQLPDKKILREKDLQNKIDAVFPSVSLNPISTHLVWNGGQFLLKELCHFSKSVLIESLNIESASCIRFSDKEKYEKGNIETKISLEIPVPRSAVFRSFTNFGRSKYGTNPIIVSDDLYSEDLGLQWKEIENIF